MSETNDASAVKPQKQNRSAEYDDLDKHVEEFQSKVIVSDVKSTGKCSGKHRPAPSSTGTLSRKLRHSNFYITANTNKTFPDREDPELDRMIGIFTTALEELLESASLPRFMRFQDPTHSWSAEYIKRVCPESVVEVGNKKNCLHSHSLVCIAHYSNIQLDISGLREALKEALGLDLLYLHLQLYRNAHDNLQTYLDKNVKH